jgi:hypothetical protein
VVAGAGVCTTTAGSGLHTAARNPAMISYGARVGTGVARLARGDTVCSLGGDWCTPGRSVEFKIHAWAGAVGHR